MTEPTKSWRRIRSEPGPDLIILRGRFDWYENPRNGIEFKRVVLEARDWVNVIAITSDDRILFVRQFRFGIGGETTEIPAGIVEEGESPEDAGRRELREETGFAADEWQYLGWVQPNPAFLNNRCHTFMAKGAERKGAPELEEGEDIAVEELSLEQVKQAIRRGEIRNSLAVVALSYVFDLRGSIASDADTTE